MTQILYHPPFHFLLVQNFLLVENNDRRRRFCFFFSFSFLPTIPFFFRNTGISSRHCYCATPIHAGPVTSAFESTIFSLSVRTLECDGDGMGDQKNYRTMKNTPDRRRHRHVTKSIPRGMVLEKKKVDQAGQTPVSCRQRDVLGPRDLHTRGFFGRNLEACFCWRPKAPRG